MHDFRGAPGGIRRGIRDHSGQAAGPQSNMGLSRSAAPGPGVPDRNRCNPRQGIAAQEARPAREARRISTSAFVALGLLLSRQMFLKIPQLVQASQSEATSTPVQVPDLQFFGQAKAQDSIVPAARPIAKPYSCNRPMYRNRNVDVNHSHDLAANSSNRVRTELWAD